METRPPTALRCRLRKILEIQGNPLDRHIYTVREIVDLFHPTSPDDRQRYRFNTRNKNQLCTWTTVGRSEF